MMLNAVAVREGGNLCVTRDIIRFVSSGMAKIRDKKIYITCFILIEFFQY